MAGAPELSDAAGLIIAVAAASHQGIPVLAFEEPSRFPLPNEMTGLVHQEFPSATRLWQAWCMASDEARSAWARAVPEPIYLKPPHITPAKSKGLLSPWC